ncbi:MAG TPA: ATP-binding protein [Pyrinomonadaceae bacterium]|jgi:hypothetical protein
MTLNQDLEMLRALNEARDRAKQMRQQALPALKAFERFENDAERNIAKSKKVTINRKRSHNKSKGEAFSYEKWVFSKDNVENALLVKVQAHRDISENEEENNKAKANEALKKSLTGIKFEDLIQPITGVRKEGEEGEEKKEKKKDASPITVPVLVAARAMQALTQRAETVFEPATMRCYYRIVRELYGVAQPNWTVGAARAGVGGTTSAFITNECLRAILSFRNALDKTHEFFKHTLAFYKRYNYLRIMLEEWHILDKDQYQNHPLYIWADKTIEAMWLDCYLATNPRNQEMALFLAEGENKNENILLLPKEELGNFKNAENYFKKLDENLEKALNQLYLNLAQVYEEITVYRDSEYKLAHREDPLLKKGDAWTRDFNEKVRECNSEAISKINRSQTAHLFAQEVIIHAIINARDLLEIILNAEKKADDNSVSKTETILEELSKNFYEITRSVNRVLEPSKQYIKWVLNRELAASDFTFDAGELVFAATSYGALNNWQLDEKLSRACEKLINALPDDGRFATKRPFHADSHGYRLTPIGSEMTRALANLLQKTGYDFDATFVDKMLKMFEEHAIELPESRADAKRIAWNFKGAPEPEKPALWVTAVHVLALDRIVRMLNTRINEIVLEHFDVIKPDRPHTVDLVELIYSDYGLVEWHLKDDKRQDGKSKLLTINLQKMRAHVMRATLPNKYQGDKENFSAIFYGPPGTGKTTLAESLALSSKVPFVKLSPSDLILQGQEMLEGRARDVFEALSMLTRCVIIFDEFEPVLKSRKKKERLKSRIKETEDNYYDEQMAIALQEISQSEDPKFRFVLGGMLPKFGKLHDVAKKQSLVYCLGTNVLKDIDEAAKRPGRFDKQFPVYKPDTLSRAGTLFYRLGQMRKSKLNNKQLKGSISTQIRRFSEAVAFTADKNAEQISRKFFNPKDSDILKYILNDKAESPFENLPENEIANAIKQLNEALLDDDNTEKKEKEELGFIIKAEDKFKDILKMKANLTVETLDKYLNAEKLSEKSENVI